MEMIRDGSRSWSEMMVGDGWRWQSGMVRDASQNGAKRKEKLIIVPMSPMEGLKVLTGQSCGY